MTPDEFLFPFALFRNGVIIGTGFRKRNHLIPCTTRRKKTMQRKVWRVAKQMLPATMDTSEKWFSIT
jgi:hypothetical protein